MDELIDIVTSEDQPTGKTALKSVAHKLGLFHDTVHIWLYTPSGEILMQKRSSSKQIYPNLWDVSVAGHIGAGENKLTAAVREIEEEIGIIILEDELHKIGVFKSKQKHPNKLLDFEFHHTYLARVPVDVKSLSLQKNEVDAVKLCTLQQLKKEIVHPTLSKTIVPHGMFYFENVLAALKKAITK